MEGVPRCTGYCHDLGQPCKTEGWSCSWSVTAGALHIWTPDNQEFGDQCPRQTRPGTIPGSRNKGRNSRATATRHLATPIPPGYPVYPTYPYPYPAPPPRPTGGQSCPLSLAWSASSCSVSSAVS